MAPPSDVSLPFFSYGLFKPGQLGFHRLRAYIGGEGWQLDRVSGALYERDGVPLIDYGASGCCVRGAILRFDDGRAAYAAIVEIEPTKQYRWAVAHTQDGVKCNLLLGIKPTKGSEHIGNDEWDGKSDPLFNEALKTVSPMVESHEPGNIDSLLYLQMAYMLLWTSIERYVSLRHGLRGEIRPKLKQMAADPAFKEALSRIEREDTIFSSDDFKPQKLAKDDAAKAIDYYYQLRCNISHRGKAIMTDGSRLKSAIRELSNIFQSVRDSAFSNNQDLLHMRKTESQSVNEYIASCDAGLQPILERVRSAIRKALPEAEEGISYQIPVYKLNDKPVIYFAGWKKHYSLYPANVELVAALKPNLAPYEISKGTIRFPNSEPVPVELIGRIATFRAKEVLVRLNVKGRLTPVAIKGEPLSETLLKDRGIR